MPDALFDLPSQPALLQAERAVRTVESEHPDPVARVVLDTPFSWPDKYYDYLIPEKLHEKALPGARVRVEFGSKRLTGFLRERTNTTDSPRLRPLVNVLGEPVVKEEIFLLAEQVARNNVCSVHDFLRGAVPPRHARAAKAILELPAPVFDEIEMQGGAFDSTDSSSDASSSTALPTHDLLDGHEKLLLAGRSTWQRVAASTQLALSKNVKVLIVCPTSLDVKKCRQAVVNLLPKEPIALIEASASAETRYRHYLSALLGRTRIVIGTRAAAATPINAGLLIVVDEQNGAMRDKRSPYLWADDVLRARKQIGEHLGMGERTLLRFSYPPRLTLNESGVVTGGEWPKVTRAEQWAGDQRGILPNAAFETIRKGLESGAVLISAPRAGYVPALACASCGKRAVCQDCGSSIAVPKAGSNASCTRCGTGQWRCSCGSTKLRAVARGSQRLAQEIARAFPSVEVDSIRSGTESTGSPIVIATPGAEPDREFSAGVIIDAGARLASLALDAEIEAIGRWSRVAMKVSDHLLLAGGVPPHLAHALANRDLGFLMPLLEEREVLGQPPFHRWFHVSGKKPDIQRLLGEVAARLEGEAPPEQGIAALLSGGGRQVFAEGIHLVGPTEDETGLSLYLHERTPSKRLARALRDSFQHLGQLAIRVEADPIL